jgi:hypothetical protein
MFARLARAGVAVGDEDVRRARSGACGLRRPADN